VLERALAGTTSLGAAASAYGTAFWWSLGITALAIVPCVVLVRAERAARARHHDASLTELVPAAEAA
jgi:hypothetical protein